MAGYKNFLSAIKELHDRGFTQDFVLFEQYLYWTQEKLFISPMDFSIEECHRFAFPAPTNKRDDLVVFGVTAVSGHVKGILLNHYTYTTAIPDIIRMKLSDMGYYKKEADWVR
jgi:hypothetical protein